jgi:hypothetical protein
MGVVECMQREETTLISYGDCVQPGYYRPHSSFENAINFTKGKRLVSLVNKKVGSGPFHIVLSRLNNFRTDSIRVTGLDVEAGEVRLQFDESKKYISVPSPLLIDIPSAQKLLFRFQDILVNSSPVLSLVFLIDGRRKRNLVSAFEKALVERAVNGWNCFMKGNCEEGIRLMKGTGYGFTPSGDDFIAGMATGLYMIRHFFKRDRAEEIELFLRSSTSENIVSECFIASAAKGHFMARIKTLIEAIMEGNEKDLILHAPGVIATGETSGADFSTGLLCAFKMHALID